MSIKCEFVRAILVIVLRLRCLPEYAWMRTSQEWQEAALTALSLQKLRSCLAQVIFASRLGLIRHLFTHGVSENPRILSVVAKTVAARGMRNHPLMRELMAAYCDVTGTY